MAKKQKVITRENSFDGAPGGFNGTLSYGQQYGTPSGGNDTQNPSKFSSSDKTVSHFTSETTGSSAVPKMPDRNKAITPNTNVSPAGKADQLKADAPLNPENQYEKHVDALFAPDKKETPTPDQILQGLEVELGKMVKKDKTIAKQIVLKNLRKQHDYYSTLSFLNINDKDMSVESTFSKTKNLLDWMINERKNQIVEIPNIKEIFDELKLKRNLG